MPAVTTSRMISLTDMSDAALDALLGMGETAGEAWLDAHDLNEPAALVVLARGGAGPGDRSRVAWHTFRKAGELFTAEGEITALGESVRDALIEQHPSWAAEMGA